LNSFSLIPFGFAIFWCQNIGKKSAHKMLMKLTPGVNFTNVLRAAFAPVDLRPTYWRTAQRVQHRSWADFLVLWTRRVGCRFVGETEWRKRMTTSAFALCASGLVKLTPEGGRGDAEM